MPIQKVGQGNMSNALKMQLQSNSAQQTMQEHIHPQIPMKNLTTEEPKKEKKFTDFFQRIKNPADMQDTIKIPRIVFKGYLGFVVGTGLMTIGAFVKNNKKLSTVLHAAGTLATIYGTFAFVKPYIIKGKDGKQVQEGENK